jgi:hypothetical protein
LRRRMQAYRHGRVRLVGWKLPSNTATSPKLNSSQGLQYSRVYSLAHLLRKVPVPVPVLPRRPLYDRDRLPPLPSRSAFADAPRPGLSASKIVSIFPCGSLLPRFLGSSGSKLLDSFCHAPPPLVSHVAGCVYLVGPATLVVCVCGVS